MPHLLREFNEYETALLLRDELPSPLRPTRLSPVELKLEVQLFLRRGKATKRLSVAAEDVQNVQTSLRLLLDRAESIGGRAAVAAAYTTGQDRDPGEVYRRDKYTYASAGKFGPLDLNVRMKLASAACAVLGAHDPSFDETSALLTILGPSALTYVTYNSETEALVDSGRMVSDAWHCISEALDSELNLGEWFSSFPDIVDGADEIIAELLALETTACVPSMPDADLGFEELEIARHLGPPEVADDEEYNFMRHPQDEALAPSVVLFSLAMLKVPGRLSADKDAAKKGERAHIRFWREVTLQLLPRRGGGIVPCVTLVPKISLCDPAGRPIELRTPFSRPLGDLRRVPLLLTRTSAVTWFYPESLTVFEDPLPGVGWSVDSVYQTAWMASPGVVAILLRMIEDGVERPIGHAVTECADRNCDFPSQFALGTIGNVIERATFATSRGDGIGALLREDFHRRDRILRKHGVIADRSPSPARFYRAWK